MKLNVGNFYQSICVGGSEEQEWEGTVLSEFNFEFDSHMAMFMMFFHTNNATKTGIFYSQKNCKNQEIFWANLHVIMPHAHWYFHTLRFTNNYVGASTRLHRLVFKVDQNNPINHSCNYHIDLQYNIGLVLNYFSLCIKVFIRKDQFICQIAYGHVFHILDKLDLPMIFFVLYILSQELYLVIELSQFLHQKSGIGYLLTSI